MLRSICFIIYILNFAVKETSNGTDNVAITEISERFALREAQKLRFLKE